MMFEHCRGVSPEPGTAERCVGGLAEYFVTASNAPPVQPRVRHAGETACKGSHRLTPGTTPQISPSYNVPGAPATLMCHWLRSPASSTTMPSSGGRSLKYSSSLRRRLGNGCAMARAPRGAAPSHATGPSAPTRRRFPRRCLKAGPEPKWLWTRRIRYAAQATAQGNCGSFRRPGWPEFGRIGPNLADYGPNPVGIGTNLVEDGIKFAKVGRLQDKLGRNRTDNGRTRPTHRQPCSRPSKR